MHVKVGYELIYDVPQPTPMILMLTMHHSWAPHVVVPDHLVTDPQIPVASYRDGFGNWCSRIVAPTGRIKLRSDAIVKCSGEPDVVAPSARQIPVQELPDDTLVYLLGSRYCETDRLSQTAWDLFGKTPLGWPRVQAICDYVHQAIVFDYMKARATKSAFDVFDERSGVCRDFAHLAVTFCRCMNIPARYCTGYLSDIEAPLPHGPMDFAAWFEAYLDGQWYCFDPRNNIPRVGRVLIAQGRDAADVPISNTFGPNQLTGFTVWADEVAEESLSA